MANGILDLVYGWYLKTYWLGFKKLKGISLLIAEQNVIYQKINFFRWEKQRDSEEVFLTRSSRKTTGQWTDDPVIFAESKNIWNILFQSKMILPMLHIGFYHYWN